MESFAELLHELRKECSYIKNKVEPRIKDYDEDPSKFSEQELDAQRELHLARTKIQEAKMWLGKALSHTDEELPEDYPKDEA